jgi:hypothetical protein
MSEWLYYGVEVTRRTGAATDEVAETRATARKIEEERILGYGVRKRRLR